MAASHETRPDGRFYLPYLIQYGINDSLLWIDGDGKLEEKRRIGTENMLDAMPHIETD